MEEDDDKVKGVATADKKEKKKKKQRDPNNPEEDSEDSDGIDVENARGGQIVVKAKEERTEEEIKMDEGQELAAPAEEDPPVEEHAGEEEEPPEAEGEGGTPRGGAGNTHSCTQDAPQCLSTL